MSQIRQLTQQLFANEIFHFYNRQREYDYFPTHLNSLLDGYMEVIDNEEFLNELFHNIYPDDNDTFIGYQMYVPPIRELCLSLKQCIDHYYKGEVNQAYKALESGLKREIYSRETQSVTPSVIIKEASTYYEKSALKLYRIRVRNKSEDEIFTLKEMFHIPFEKREYVSTQRFSIPGHPSLYMGDSVYVCWEELGHPPIEAVYASKLQNKVSLNLIELLRTEDLMSSISELNERDFARTIMRFVLTFPLNIACSIKTKRRDGVFKPEYIIPQLFLQFVMENKEQIDGIKYYSTRVDYKRVENVGTYNFIFPARTSKEEGYCSVLKNKFAITEPLLWEYEQMAMENAGPFVGSGPRRGITLEIYKGRKVPYDWTSFRGIEVALDYPGMELKNLD